MKKRIQFLSLVFLLVMTFFSHAQEITVKVNKLNLLAEHKGIGQEIGEILLRETQYGLLIWPQITGLPSGPHGFHIHEMGTCQGVSKDGIFVAGLAAGGHLDPLHTEQHLGPYEDKGHLGDLPPLYCDLAGVCNTQILAPKLKLKDIKGRSIIIHAEGDNFSDKPLLLGGGGARIACGVIPK